MTPLIQLIHISDLHIIASTSADPAAGRRALHQLFGHIPVLSNAAVDFFMRGVQGHDTQAWDDFVELFYDEPELLHRWEGRTRLICTGDLSTWGDDASLTLAHDQLNDLAKALKLGWHTIYGNHDVWPGVGSGPWSCNNTALGHRRTAMRQSYFGNTFPLSLPPHVNLNRGGVLSFHALNTIQHEQWPNTIARGRVQGDYYWDAQRSTPHQLQRIGGHVGAEVRVFLTHHPVCDPAKLPFKKLSNRAQVAGSLAAAAGPLKHCGFIILSGHTHKLNPPHGQLPQAIGANNAQAPLVEDQAQLTTGTLSQRSYAGKGGNHLFQRLRFFEDGDQLVLERRVYERSSGLMGFQPVATSAGQTDEVLTLNLC